MGKDVMKWEGEDGPTIEEMEEQKEEEESNDLQRWMDEMFVK